MAGSEPGDRTTTRTEAPGRRLAAPPSNRYPQDRGTATPGPDPAGDQRASALPGPLVRALAVAVAGAAVLVLVGAILASLAGLLFIAGITGAAIGLTLARAAVPRDDARAVPRHTVAWVAVALAITTIATSAVAIWLVAFSEGGTLELVDYLMTTFGPFVPGEAAIAALAAAWGAHAGPVQA